MSAPRTALGAAMEAQLLRMSACAPVLVPRAVAFASSASTIALRRHSLAFVGCVHRARSGAGGRGARTRCYREEGAGSGGASSAPDGPQPQSGQGYALLL